MTTIRSPRSFLGLPVAALAVCLLTASAVSADQVVYFVNGKAIMVKSVERGERFTILEIEGGGKMGVPTEQIVKIEEFQVQAPMAQAPMAPMVVPVAQIPIVTAAPPPLAGGAPSLPAVPGPGIGGTPQAPAIQGMAPLNIGGTGQAYQVPRPQQALANRPTLGGPAGALQPAPGYQRPALYGPGGRKLGRQGMGRRGGVTPFAPPGAPPGQTTNQPAGPGGQQTTTPQDPPDDPGAPEQGEGDPEQQEPPTGGGESQNPGGSPGD